MSDGALKRWLLLDRSNVEVDRQLLAVHAVVCDVGYFTENTIS